MASANFNERTEKFLQWFKQLPGATFSDAIQIVDFRDRDAGRGIVATKDIEADTTLFTIPRRSIINVETSALSKRVPGVFGGNDDEKDELDSWSALILVMMYEYLQGEASTWRPYFDVLPAAFDTPMFWCDAELDQLQASAVLGKIGKQDAEEMFRAQILPVIRAHPDVFGDGVSVAGMRDEELVGLAHRMGSTIMAYAFDLENEEERDEEGEEDGWVEDRDGKGVMGMVPMADILNADAEFNAHVNHGDDDLTVTALRPIKAGEEILNYYGPHPNSELLRRYGYVTPLHARYDVVEVPWDVVEEEAREHFGLSAEMLEQVRGKMDEDEMEDTFILERATDEPSAEGLLPSTTPPPRATIPDDLHAQLKQLLKTLAKTHPDALPDKRKRDEASKEILARTVRALQKRYVTSIEEDEELLRKGEENLGRRARMAVVVRVGEKRVLREVEGVLGSGGGEGEEMDVDVDERAQKMRRMG